MKEKSCGAIVYKREKDEFRFLLVYQSNDFYSFPKGHVEGNETEIETALREIKEETNLDVEIDSNFRGVFTFLLESKNILKDVVYFVATPKTFDLKKQEGEIVECGWYDYNTVLEKLEYENTKEIFKQAYDYIKNKETRSHF